MPDCTNSIANTLQLLQSTTELSKDTQQSFKREYFVE